MQQVIDILGGYSGASFPVQAMWMIALVNFTWFTLSVVMYAIDKRTLFGENVWVKPIRFGSSLALHYATLAIVIGWLGMNWQNGTTLYLMSIVSIVAITFQVLFIGIQAARGQLSHYNEATPLLRLLQRTMAVCAALVTLPMALVGVIVLVDASFMMSEPVRLAVVFGLVIGTVLTFVTAFHLALTGPLIRSKNDEDRRIPILDWSLDHGDLRPAHFLSTHMMQIVPFAGVVMSLMLPESIANAGVFTFAALWTFYTVDVYRQALKGRPVSQVWLNIGETYRAAGHRNV